MYKVIHFFTDLHDNNHPYNVGDAFPRKGLTVTDERLAELAGKDNKQGVPLVVKTEDAPEVPAKAPAKRAAKKTAEK